MTSIAQRGDGLWVNTAHTSESGFKSDYAYHFELLNDGRLQLKELYYVDSEGRYPCL